MNTRNSSRNPPQSGLTLPDVLAVIATLGILAILIVPALGNQQPKAAQCLGNMRELALAWTLYAGENNDRLAINSDPSLTYSPYYRGTPSWVSGVIDWTAGSQNTNAAFVVDPRYSLLGVYCGQNPQIFACPSANYLSRPQRALGWTHRVRSVAMNGAVGDGNKYQQPYNPFGWIDWYVARKTADFQSPEPSDVFVLLDEHPDSIDDQIFYVDPDLNNRASMLPELPGSDHDGACGLNFADGHATLHKWQATVARQPVTYTVRQRIPAPANDADALWLALHTPHSP
jgi:hypothetical protein